MPRKTLLAVTLAASLYLSAGTAMAGVTCQTDAAAEIAGASVNGPRTDWNPPVWDFFMSDLNLGVSVQADMRDEANAKAQAWLSDQVSSACTREAIPPQPPASGNPAPSATASPSIIAQATDLVNAAHVVFRGASWGPVPLYTVELPSLNMGIDVAANSTEEARANVLPSVIVALGGTWSAPVSAGTAPSLVAPLLGQPTTASVVTASSVLAGAVAGANRFGAVDPAIAAAMLATG